MDYVDFSAATLSSVQQPAKQKSHNLLENGWIKQTQHRIGVLISVQKVICYMKTVMSNKEN